VIFKTLIRLVIYKLLLTDDVSSFINWCACDEKRLLCLIWVTRREVQYGMCDVQLTYDMDYIPKRHGDTAHGWRTIYLGMVERCA